MERERDIEKYLCEQVKALGGIAYKFVSPGHSGVPDRLVCFRGGLAVFVELKAPGQQPTSLQTACHTRLRGLGFPVYVLDSKAAVDNFAFAYRAVL